MPEPPTYDFPVGASQEETDQYLKVDKTRNGDTKNSQEHHQKENERISKLYHRKKSLHGKGGTDSNNNDNKEEERAKELNCIR